MSSNINVNGNGNATNNNGNGNATNLADIFPTMQKAAKGLGKSTKSACEALEFLADCGRKGFLATGNFEIANTAIQLIKQNAPIWIEKFVQNFGVYCGGYFLTQTDSGMAYVKDKSVALYKITSNGLAPISENWENRLNNARANSKAGHLPKSLLKVKFQSPELAEIARAKKQYEAAIANLKKLHAARAVWADDPQSEEIAKLLKAASTVLPYLAPDYTEKTIQEIETKTRKATKSATK